MCVMFCDAAYLRLIPDSLLFSHIPRVSTMAKSQQSTGRSCLLSSLNMAIEAMSAAMEAIISVDPAKNVFSPVGVWFKRLSMIIETLQLDPVLLRFFLDKTGGWMWGSSSAASCYHSRVEPLKFQPQALNKRTLGLVL